MDFSPAVWRTSALRYKQAAEHRIICCAAIRDEVRRRLRGYKWSVRQVDKAMSQYTDPGDDIVTNGHLRGLCRDPKDDVILECVMLANANFLLTGDKDLLTLETIGDTIILQAREYLGRDRFEA